MLYLLSVSWGTTSGWWTLACLVVAICYSVILYHRPANINRIWKNLLFAFRTLAVFSVCFLLLAPLLKTVDKHLQKPLILILQDNSASIKKFPAKNFHPKAFLEDLHQLKTNLGDDYEVQEFHFDKNLSAGISDSLNGKQTDISNAFQNLNNRYSNQNIGAVILASDGLFNRGSSPLNIASTLKSNIYTIVLGDTIPKLDILIDHVDYNKTAFLGNDFVIDVSIEARQSKGKSIQLRITEDGKPVASQQLNASENNFKKSFPVKLNADKKGIHKFQVSLQSLAGEISTANNVTTIYVEVIDNRKKILILYDAPHPDVTAIRQSLGSNQNYEVKTSLLSDFDLTKLNTYNTLILEQLPNNRVNIQPLLTQANRLKLPVFYLLGAQSNLQQFNSLQKIISISSSNSSTQEVFALPDASFTTFILSDSAKTKISNFPPLLAPFGNYGNTSASILLKQKIGRVATSYPLLAFGEENGQRKAVLAGEGLWRWRLNEFQQFGNHRAFDELLSQSIQYLSVKSNRKRFEALPTKPVFDEDENVAFHAELYDQSFELVNQPEIAISLKNTNGKKYDFQFSKQDHSYQLNAGILPAGDYSYIAQTRLGNEVFKSNGNFSVKALITEDLQSAANQQLLYALAKENGGEMLTPQQLNKLPDLIRKNENIKTIAYQENKYKELIDEKWVFVLVLLLLSLEWFLRRRNGEI
ncbi:MAG: hypothetical protein EOP42_05520 [Sphingobacteriaceae bacterium]|nr:MAG: hypothetical protein EOP42_05520 [Sphingobacteriaceae bacterium]